MDDYRCIVEPFMHHYIRYIRELVRHTLPNTTFENVRANITFIQDQKARILVHGNTLMTRYWYEALQDQHFPRHFLPLTRKRSEQLMCGREKAIQLLAGNSALLEIEHTALEMNVPTTALDAIPWEEFERIERLEKPETYQAKDELMLENSGIRTWVKK